ncbi:MAG TPA: alpha/beta hydrolase [Rhizomicrobium sp.]|jgi:pimeloyl-ACP methyl ester carboxylesterase
MLAAAASYWGLRVYTPEIPSDPGRPGRAIASLEPIILGGDRQWLLIRGHDRGAPIVLFLHGGPGMPMMYLAYAFQRPLENDFLVVQWDRRGAGKSYHAGIDPAEMRLSQEIADTISLIGDLRARFGAGKIILVGHSYGSTLGILVAQRRPDLIRAYVGVGQEACDRATELGLQDRWIADEAHLHDDADAAALASSGRPYDREPWLFRYGGEIAGASSFLHLVAIGLRAPEYSLLDAYHVKTGVDFTHSHLKNDIFRGALINVVSSLDVPVYFLEGRRDYTVPFACAEAFFDRIRAPQKQFVWFDRSAHFPFLEEPAKFREVLNRVATDTASNP